VVIDASAAVFAALNYSPGVLDHADFVLTPDLFVSEVTNALWKQHQLGGTDLSICESALEEALRFPNVFVPATTLYREAFLLARAARHSAYDMFYLALARREGATLFTKDKALRKLAQHQGIDVA
jgi:predicted nucleic acid-binding protein